MLVAKSGKMSARVCRVLAAAQGLSIFGLQNGNECWGGACAVLEPITTELLVIHTLSLS